MKVLFLGIMLVRILENTIAIKHLDTNVTQPLNKEKTKYIDVLIQDLSDHVWAKEETQCLQETTSIINNIKNSSLWATWMWDSIQHPVGVLLGTTLQLGNFDECLNAPWKTSHPELRAQYCLAEVQFGSLEHEKRNSFDPYGSTIPYIESLSKFKILWGVCVPEACKSSSISKILRTLLHISHFGSMESNATIKVEPCQVAGKPHHQYTTSFFIFIVLALTLIVMALTSTWYVNRVQQEKHQPSIITNLANSFCINKNIQDLVKPYKEDIKVFHGIKFLSACIVVMFHQHYDLFHGLEVKQFKDSTLGFMFIHTGLIVDTFLMISGLLLAKSCVSRRMANPIIMLLKRYIRLIGPFAVIVFYMAAVFKYVGSGPLWTRLVGLEEASCQKNWWLSLLMVNNIIDVKNICYGSSWYVACDYQLTVVGTAVFYLRQKNRNFGAAAFAAVAVMSILIPGLITFWNEYFAVPVLDKQNKHSVQGYIYIHMPSYSRAGSYVVGMTSGYFMSIYKPAAYRRVMSQKLSLLVTFLAMALMCSIMYLGGWLYNREYDVLEASIFAALNRVAWAVALFSIVASCEYGIVPIISDFLSWSVFVPLSRLSYSLYLIHSAFTLRNIASSRSPWRMDLFIMVTDSLGIIAVSCFASLVMWLLIEAPIINLSKLVFDSKCCLRKRQIKENTTVNAQVEEP